MNTLNKERWHIVGHGAIGLLWAHKLSTAHKVEIILRQNSEQAKAEYTYIDINQKQHAICVNKTISNTNKLNNHKIKNLLIPTKAYDVIPALKQLQPFLTDTCTIVLCHNGMGTIEQALTLLKPQQNLYFATTTHGAYKPDKFTVKHTGLGETKIGLIQGKDTLATNNHLLTPTTWQQNINLTLWSKLAINCAINPLTAIHNCKNGDLAQPQYRKTLKQICQEFSLVANTALNAQPFESIPFESMPFSTEQLLNQCLTVIEATAQNYSSMHQDVKYQRQSEIDYITGFVINKASELNLSVPTHQLIYRQFGDITTQHQKSQ